MSDDRTLRLILTPRAEKRPPEFKTVWANLTPEQHERFLRLVRATGKRKGACDSCSRPVFPRSYGPIPTRTATTSCERPISASSKTASQA